MKGLTKSTSIESESLLIEGGETTLTLITDNYSVITCSSELVVSVTGLGKQRKKYNVVGNKDDLSIVVSPQKSKSKLFVPYVAKEKPKRDWETRNKKSKIHRRKK